VLNKSQLQSDSAKMLGRVTNEDKILAGLTDPIWKQSNPWFTLHLFFPSVFKMPCSPFLRERRYIFLILQWTRKYVGVSSPNNVAASQLCSVIEKRTTIKELRRKRFSIMIDESRLKNKVNPNSFIPMLPNYSHPVFQLF